jgi:hypothetical protein
MPAILTQYAIRDAVIIFISAELHLQSVRRTTLHLFLVNLNKKGECVAVAGPGFGQHRQRPESLPPRAGSAGVKT